MNEYKYKINGHDYCVSIEDTDDCVAHVKVNGVGYEVEMEPKPEAIRPVVARPVAQSAAPIAATPKASKAAPGTVQSPLPGVIVDIKVSVGDEVSQGQTLLTLEAMKMENTITADQGGTVKAIHVSKGDSVGEGAELITIA